MTEEERAVAYLAARRAMVAARNARLDALAGDPSAVADLRQRWAPADPAVPRSIPTADDPLPPRVDAPQEV